MTKTRKRKDEVPESFKFFMLTFCILVAFLAWRSIITGSFESLCEEGSFHPSFWEAFGCIFMLLWRLATYIVAPLATSFILFTLTDEVKSK